MAIFTHKIESCLQILLAKSVTFLTMVRDIWFLSPLFPSKREENIQTETT